MKQRIIQVIILILAAALCLGCSALLEGYIELETLHETTPQERPPEEQIEVSNFEELKAAILDLIMEYEDNGQLVIYTYSGRSVQTDVERAAYEIMNHHPIGAYVVESIIGHATRIVSRFEVDISIEYKRVGQQLDSIVNVSTLRYLRTELLSVMSDYREEALIRTSLQITAEDIIRIVEETYYQNPRRIVIMPVTVIDIFPEEGDDRLFELRFGYIELASILQQRGEDLAVYVRRNAELAVGETDAEILLSIVNNLIASTNYDEGVARTISVHGAQNFAATAYGALATGSAVGEGFAMAFKALCDELGFDCQVVLGYLDGRIHAWNIVSLYGEYYHIDVAMGSAYGVETAFLKTDADMEDRYVWDRENTVRANGTLTYEDIVGPEEDEDEEDLNGEEGESPEEGNGADPGGGDTEAERPD